MPKHRKPKHYKCTTCHRTFILHGRRQHEYGSGHAQYVEVNLPDPAQPAGRPGASAQLTISGSVTSRESITEIRRKYDALIRTLLCECRTGTTAALPGETRWSEGLRLLSQILPEDREIPIARIGAISDTADGVEVWYATQEEIRPLVHQGFVFRKPTVIRPRQPIWGQDLDSFLETLNDDFAGSVVDVQDPSATDKNAVPMPVDATFKPAGPEMLRTRRTDSRLPPNASLPCSPDSLYTPWDKVQWQTCRREAGPRIDEADMATFADEGDEWAPKKVAAIVLEPGDTLIMPPACPAIQRAATKKS
ncbi:hypothetical protein Purlil1_12085 [Purpureocillium lilacinum]|uniref:C2H2-type domain-containing protein n=1 Tax=Purpureocillium lilacinum TaxID=33203 RepID=A0ABR0BIJ0_PURLI|nr:hypothetical protein Purlil1_12085 [Purpureocillium lilacinum]